MWGRQSGTPRDGTNGATRISGRSQQKRARLCLSVLCRMRNAELRIQRVECAVCVVEFQCLCRIQNALCVCAPLCRIQNSEFNVEFNVHSRVEARGTFCRWKYCSALQFILPFIYLYMWNVNVEHSARHIVL